MRAGRVEIDAESHNLTEVDLILPIADAKVTPKNQHNQFQIQEYKWKNLSEASIPTI